MQAVYNDFCYEDFIKLRLTSDCCLAVVLFYSSVHFSIFIYLFIYLVDNFFPVLILFYSPYMCVNAIYGKPRTTIVTISDYPIHTVYISSYHCQSCDYVLQCAVYWPSSLPDGLSRTLTEFYLMTSMRTASAASSEIIFSTG